MLFYRSLLLSSCSGGYSHPLRFGRAAACLLSCCRIYSPHGTALAQLCLVIKTREFSCISTPVFHTIYAIWCESGKFYASWRVPRDSTAWWFGVTFRFQSSQKISQRNTHTNVDAPQCGYYKAFFCLYRLRLFLQLHGASKLVPSLLHRKERARPASKISKLYFSISFTLLTPNLQTIS